MEPPQTAPVQDAACRAEPRAATSRTGGKVSSSPEIAVVQADYLALSNDLQQAQALASSLEMQLSGKTNELARFKLIWERTQADLAKFEHDLNVMRQERHTLANDAQRAYAFEHKIEKMKASHEGMTARIERLESELAGERAAHAQTRTELEQLREKLPSAKPQSTNPATTGDRELRRALEAIRAQIDTVLGGNPVRPERADPPVKAAAAAAEHIEIEFSA